MDNALFGETILSSSILDKIEKSTEMEVTDSMSANSALGILKYIKDLKSDLYNRKKISVQKTEKTYDDVLADILVSEARLSSKVEAYAVKYRCNVTVFDLIEQDGKRTLYRKVLENGDINISSEAKVKVTTSFSNNSKNERNKNDN